MDNVENNINLLIAEIKKSDIDRDVALDYIGHIFRTITTNNVDDRQGASLTVNDYLKKARGGDFRYASGFYGNWAKAVEEDQDVGC